MTRSGLKTRLQSGWLDLSTGGIIQPTTVAMALIQNCHHQLQEIDNDEVKPSTEVANAFIEYSNVGTGTAGSLEHTSELKLMKYNEAINGPDGEAGKAEIENEHNCMSKKLCV